MLLIFYKGIEKEIYDQGRQKSCRKKNCRTIAIRQFITTIYST